MVVEARLKVSASPFASWLHNELFRAAALHKSSGTVSTAASFCDPLVAVDGNFPRRHRPFSLFLLIFQSAMLAESRRDEAKARDAGERHHPKTGFDVPGDVHTYCKILT